MKKFLLFALPMLTLVSVCLAQSTNTEMFENAGPSFSPLPNGFGFSATGTGGFISGTTAVGSRPAGVTYGFGGGTGYQVTNGTSILTSADLSTVGSNFAALIFKLQALSNNNTNGMEASDFVRVEISPNGGATWWNTLEVTGIGASGNACWSYAGTGIAQGSYDGNNTPTVFAATANDENADGFGTVVVRGLPIGNPNLRVRITMDNNGSNETWVIDAVMVIRTAGGPLPVNFANVSAKERSGSVLVNWSNLTESDIHYYEVERSTDGKNFATIGKVQPRGNDFGKQEYSFTDATPARTGYYRVKAVEFNSSTKSSVILKVNSERSPAAFVVYPNPVQNRVVTLQSTNINAGSYSVQIVNANGQQVFAKTLNLQAGSASQSIELPASVKPGMYMLRVEGTGTSTVTTIFIQ